MERHFSTGVVTITALMSAHRAASGREGLATSFLQEEAARIEAWLLEESEVPQCPCGEGYADPSPRAR